MNVQWLECGWKERQREEGKGEERKGENFPIFHGLDFYWKGEARKGMEGLFLTHGFLNNDFVIFTATKNVCRFAVNFHKQSTQTIFSDTSKSRMFTKRFGKSPFCNSKSRDFQQKTRVVRITENQNHQKTWFAFLCETVRKNTGFSIQL